MTRRSRVTLARWAVPAALLVALGWLASPSCDRTSRPPPATLSYDFEKDAAGWNLGGDAWSRVPVGEGWALQGVGDGTARLAADPGSVSGLRFELTMRAARSELVAEVGGYGVLLATPLVALIHRKPDGSSEPLGSVLYSITPQEQHEVVIRVGGGSLDVFVDGDPVIGVDLPSPPGGAVGFASSGEVSHHIVDDVEVDLVPETAPHTRAPRPPLSTSPGADVGPFVGGLVSGSMALAGSESVTLAKGLYTVQGGIALSGSSRLRVEKGAVLLVDAAFGEREGGIVLRESASLEIDGGELVVSNPTFAVLAADEASVTIRDARPPIHFVMVEGRARLSVVRSRLVANIGGQIAVAGRASAQVEDSTIASIFLSVPAGASLEVAGLRTGLTFADFDLRRDWKPTGIECDLRLKNTRMLFDGMEETGTEKGWVIGASEGATLRIRDSTLHKLLLNLDPSGPDATFRDLRLGAPTTLVRGGISLENVVVTSQWLVGLSGSRRAVAENCHGLWLWLEEDAEMVLRESFMNEVDPRRYRGTLAFEHGGWSGGGEIFENSDFTIRGTFRRGLGGMPPTYVWRDSAVTRELPILLLDAKGQPLAGAAVSLARGSDTVQATTDAEGKAVASLRFGDADHQTTWKLASSGGHQADVGLLATAPLILMAPGTGFDAKTLPAFTGGGTYLGESEMGLYPTGAPDVPTAHRRAGEAIASGIRALDAQGKPDDQDGRVLALALGETNAGLYFEALRALLAERSAEVNPRLELLDAAVADGTVPKLLEPGSAAWQKAWQLATQAGHSPLQVQVLLLHATALSGCDGAGEPPGPFPESALQVQRDIGRVLSRAARVYPNLRIAYVTSDGLRALAGCEPHVWREAFAVKWAIAAQITGWPGTAFSGPLRGQPWLAWGPYFWDASWDASYFTDGSGPSAKATALVARKYWEHLSSDSVARPWLLRH